VTTVSHLAGIENLWSYFYRTSAPAISVFFAKLYGLCREEGALMDFIDRALRPIRGPLCAMKELIEFRQRIRFCKDSNAWNEPSNSVLVEVHGSFSSKVRVPQSVTSNLLIQLLSECFAVRTDEFSVRIDGRVSRDPFSITESTQIEMKLCSNAVTETTHPIDCFIEAQSNFLVGLLNHNDAEIAETALQIANKLTPVNSELELLKGLALIECSWVCSGKFSI
jgi:hypothetical protein